MHCSLPAWMAISAYTQVIADYLKALIDACAQAACVSLCVCLCACVYVRESTRGCLCGDCIKGCKHVSLHPLNCH